MKNDKNIICYDCHKQLSTDKDGNIIGGVILKFDAGDKWIHIIKCNKCKEDTSLKNYQDTEVYSRVVGYLRPIKQWNKGKQTEYHDRKVYKLK